MASPSISCRDLTLRFPVFGADARSLKKHLVNVAVGGRFSRLAGVTEVTALSAVNLELRSGDRLGLVGHNGSGKTTLLRALAGAYEPDEGAVEVNGRIGALLNLGVGVDPSASGLQNIRLQAKISGMSRTEIDAKFEQMAAFTGLGAFLAMPVKTYSAGMQARLAFAVLTAIEADVLLMDEWIAVGDAAFQEQASQRLRALVERSGILVLASHDHDILRHYCNKVMRMESGIASEIMPVEHLDDLMRRDMSSTAA